VETEGWLAANHIRELESYQTKSTKYFGCIPTQLRNL